jgi:hypothetical protein
MKAIAGGSRSMRLTIIPRMYLPRRVYRRLMEKGVSALRVQNRRTEDIPVPGLGLPFQNQEGNASVRRMDLFPFAPVAGT